MAPNQKKNASLALIIRSFSLKPPKKFNNLLITDVYRHVQAPKDLEDLLAAKYFESVLWPFFHSDVSNSHLELLLEVSVYEYDVCGLQNCLQLIKDEPKRANQLILRLLASTLTSNESNLKLEAKLYLFLRCIIKVNPELLIQNSLYPKWEEAVLLRYSAEIVEQTDLKRQYELILCFLAFAIACVSSETDLKDTMLSYVFPAYFASADNGLVRFLAQMLLFMIPNSLQDSLVSLKICLKKENLADNVPSIFQVALKYDLYPSILTEDLQLLPEAKLILLAQSIGYKGPQRPAPVLAQIITCLTIGSRHTWSYLQELHESTEETLFDLFEENFLVSYFPDPLMPFSYSDGEATFNQLLCKRVHNQRKSIGTFASASLSRLTISDPSSPQGIKGQSKYFSTLEKISSKGSLATITGLSETFRSGLRKEDIVLLLELQKPNKYGGLVRAAKFGLISCRLAKVTRNEKVLEIYRSLAELDHRFNALINTSSLKLKLPPFAYSKIPEFFVRSSNEPFKAFGEGTAILTKEQIVKKLWEESLSKLQSFPSSEALACITRFLCSYKELLQKNRVVIVVPSICAVGLFPIPSIWDKDSHKFDSSNESITRAIARINSNLVYVSELADHLGFSDYDFGDSIRKAMMFYESQILPKWQEYTRSMSESKYDHYPFESIDAASFEEYKETVAKHYYDLCSVFSDLQDLLFFDPFSLDDLSPEDVEYLNETLITKARLIIVSREDLAKVPSCFETVITYSPLFIPVLDRAKRLIITGETGLQTTNTIEFSQTEFSTHYKTLDKHEEQIPFFAHVCQKVKVPSTPQQASIEEAKFSIYLYRYMRLLGLPRTKVLIVCASPYTKVLLDEIQAESDNKLDNLDLGLPFVQMADEMFPCDYMIVSTHGGFSTAQYARVVNCAQIGLIIVGADNNEPYEIHSGKLELYKDENFQTRTKHNSQMLLKIQDFNQLMDLVNTLSSKLQAQTKEE